MYYKFTSLLMFILAWGTTHLSGQCALDCTGTLDVYLPESGEVTLGLSDVFNLDSIPANCPSLDSLEIIPGQLDCSFAGSVTPYEVRHIRTGESFCSGLISVLDTIQQEFLCRDLVEVYFREDESFHTLIQQDYLFAILDNCDRRGVFDYTPKVVDCGDVGQDITYYLTSLDQLDTLCTGKVSVIDTFAREIICKDQLLVELAPSGFPAIVFPPNVIESYSDNCNTSNSFNLSPTFVSCDMAGDNPYTLTDRTNGDTLCTGIITLIDTILPQVSCLDTLQLYLPEDGNTIDVAASDLVTLFSDNCGTADQLQVFPATTFDCSTVDSTITYELVPPGSDSIVCSGKIIVRDTFSTAVECQENVIVSLPLTYQGFELSPDIFLKESTFNCNGIGALESVPSAVFCYNAGEELTYVVQNKFSGDTVCTGTLEVENANKPTLSCADTLKVTLPRSGRAYGLGWRDVIRSFSDDCLTLFDLAVSPSYVDCSDANSFVNYAVSTRNNDNVLCEGVVEVIDDTPLSVTCKETISVAISSSGFPAIVFPPSVIERIDDNCTRQSDFRVTPTFFFCPDSNATYTLIQRSTNQLMCTGRVIVTGAPSPFGNCATASGFAPESLLSQGVNNASDGFNRAEMVLYPNPTNTGAIQLSLPVEVGSSISYRVTNLLGQQQTIGRIEYQGANTSVQLQQVPAGTYVLIAVTPEGQRFSKRFVKTQ
ncbi:MAG: hypothetical protein Sapg2KO_11370 [Saprospiraceae bacterium]